MGSQTAWVQITAVWGVSSWQGGSASGPAFPPSQGPSQGAGVGVANGESLLCEGQTSLAYF